MAKVTSVSGAGQSQFRRGLLVSEHTAPSTAQQAPAVRSGVRPEIQALRAIAVLAVVFYHLWPVRLPGGFVGVDIFFVISGFLITAHLVREVDRTGRVSLSHFWARRARRLLPASLFVLAATVLLVAAFVPQSYWMQFFREIGAATIYIENWQLAADAVDYLAADNLASPVQHFWSLSAEEQFYIVWPLIVVAAIFLSGAKASVARRRLFIGGALGLVTVASLVFSIVWTQHDAASAYFITPTRAWEFGAGGLLGIFSIAVVKNATVRTVVAWLGWAIIAFSVLTYSDALPFPGYIAIVPVVGALAVLWAGTPETRWAPNRLVSLRPVQFVGDISYSLYLWHWPLIVITPFIIDNELGSRVKLLILVLAVVLAYFTKVAIEDPVRSGGFFAVRSPRFTFVGTVAAMAIVLASVGGGTVLLQRQIEQTAHEASLIAAGDVDCFGAAGMDSGCDEPLLDGVLVPAPITLSDRGDAFDDRCVPTRESSEIVRCAYGSDKPDATVVALVGDSHAGMWLPALQEFADAKNWHIELFIKNGCAYTATTRLPDVDGAEACEKWKDNVDVALAELPDLSIMITSYRSSLVQSDAKAAAEGFVERWQPIADRGVKIYAIADIPQMEKSGVACVAKHQESGDYSSCEVAREGAFKGVKDAQEAAAEIVGGTYVDLNSHLCDDDTCYMVIGHVMAFYDRFHVTATYARTIAPFLADELK